MNCSKRLLSALIFCLGSGGVASAPLPDSQALGLPAAQTAGPDEAPEAVATKPVSVSSELKAHLLEKRYPDWARDLNWKKLQAFYANRDYQPAWRSGENLLPHAKPFRDTLIKAYEEGLNPKEYHVDAIRYLWRARRPVSRARLELLLTDAFLRYSVEVRAGYQYPRAVDHSWYMNPPKVRPVRLLQTSLQNQELPALLADLPPRHPEYGRLKEALKKYRAIEAEHSDWPEVPRTEESLRLGDRDAAVIPLRKRLTIEGFLQDRPAEHPELYDTDVETAVQTFQVHYGHEDDGIVGPRTRRSLNISLPKRIEQIQQNMERWRWLPSNLGDRYVMVNMAGYKLYLVEDGQISMDMRVIIGKPYKATPAFRNAIQYLEINPTWNIPPSIAKRDLLPKIQKDYRFLKTNRMRVWESWKKNAAELDPASINWQNLEANQFKYKLTQDPGPHNSLGSIKFMFPNGWRIYLHDTPNKALFNRRIRTFSSGCIRVERPLKLAEKLIGSPEVWSRGMLRDIIHSERTTRVQLPEDIPIYLLYWTAWADENGNMHFRDDVYDRNSNIATGPVSNESG